MCGFLVDTGSGMDFKVIEQAAALISHRGPDDYDSWSEGSRHFFFHRLAIMDESDSGMQPFVTPGKLAMVCNGEIYNEPELKAGLAETYEFLSRSDCEVLMPLYIEKGVHRMSEMLDAEYALVGYDMVKECFFASRDAMGIRPLFYGPAKSNGALIFASEAKALKDLCQTVEPFPPGYFYQSDKGKMECYRDLTLPAWSGTAKPKYDNQVPHSLDQIYSGIEHYLVKAVEKRLRSDVPVGFLLSGGLDSSLVCSIANRMIDGPITTFSIGIDKDPIDVGFARDVAAFLGTDHHEVLFTREEVFEGLAQIMFHLETWDITTVRASIGMYLLCKYIREKTHIRVVLTGEVSDELFGYKYTDFAPSAKAFQLEAEKRVRELYVYDVLRADRCISAHGLEARVPFGDVDFVNYVMGIPPEIKMNRNGVGKFILRKAFERGNYLPDHILYREKAAFSDAVGHSMVDELKKLAEGRYSDQELEQAKVRYPVNPPFSKEALMYRDIFSSMFPGLDHLIPAYWMPNPGWENCNVSDPSARALPNYGKSGSMTEASEDSNPERVAV